MRVLVSDSISPKGIEILQKAGLEVDVKTGLKPEELKAIINQYDALIIRSATKVTAEIIEAADKLKVIGRAGTGVDNVDKVAATKRGIVVMNTPGGNTVTTAEHAIAMLFSLARKIPQANASIKAGKWEKKKFMGVELYHKTIGIIGLGRIGSEVAKRAQCMGMNVLAYDPFLSEDRAEELGITKTDLDRIFADSDFITVHTPLTAETKYLINEKTIAKMKQGVYLINCARGGIINEKDLYEAIQSGKVAGAALDVFEKEPPEEGYPLTADERVICTPHLGASTLEAQENVAVAIAEQVIDYLINGTIRNAVNFPSIPFDQVPLIRPHLILLERIGSFISQIFNKSINQIQIEYLGEISNLNTQALTAAALKGILDPILGEPVNFVSAPFIAKERGIEVKEIKGNDAGDYQSLVTIKISSKDAYSTVAGTLLSRKDPRIVQIDEFSLEVIPEGNMIFMKNWDRPGVIGNIGTLLGQNSINIGHMHFGRKEPGGIAVSVISIDAFLTDEIIEKIKKLPNVLEVKPVYIPVH
ncbi:MAG TPA: phosphoglycerate dehydrogenase [Thermodesulfovibrio thiophilus]|nr:phosphoglycerate dehydrogenase [Thermodesulfovibrio thiophilus]HQD35944.1 phosphoglycerate dehydrogenase [Thermodesulfovibrio thiophilus]